MNDAQLIDKLKTLVKREAELDLEFIEALREVHRRKLFMSYGTNGFHEFCTNVLGMSGDSAWRRMHAASLVDRFPDVVKPLIAEGKVHLTGLAMLNKVITPQNGERLLQEAAGKSKTEIKAMIAREAPKPDCNAGVRKLPTKTAAPEQLSEKTWYFQANMDVEGHALFAEVADLLGSDDCNAILKRALKSLREELRVKKQKQLKASAKGDTAPVRQPLEAARPHDPDSRYVPRWMERAVRKRDGERCTFHGPGGRCTARRHLQTHHILAVALGGKTELANLTLHCAKHNRFQAELDLGPEWANSWRQHAQSDTPEARGRRLAPTASPRDAPPTMRSP